MKSSSDNWMTCKLFVYLSCNKHVRSYNILRLSKFQIRWNRFTFKRNSKSKSLQFVLCSLTVKREHFEVHELLSLMHCLNKIQDSWISISVDRGIGFCSRNSEIRRFVEWKIYFLSSNKSKYICICCSWVRNLVEFGISFSYLLFVENYCGIWLINFVVVCCSHASSYSLQNIKSGYEDI